jgi:hypothetical protein
VLDLLKNLGLVLRPVRNPRRRVSLILYEMQ